MIRQMNRGGAALWLGLALAGCTAQQATDAVLRQTAQTVVTPVLDDFLPGPQAVAATDCVLVAATSQDLRLLSRDVGVVAGTSTVQTVLGIAARPAAQACLAQSGISGLPDLGRGQAKI